MYAPRILVVDDDAQIRTLFRRILEEVGYSITTVSSAYRALMELREGSYEALIADLSIPDMDGFELIKTARQECPHLKVLIVSGFMGGAMLDLAAALGAHATLDKLLAPELLLPVVCKMLEDWGGSVNA
jgi:CheY-like chemotaxis protein